MFHFNFFSPQPRPTPSSIHAPPVYVRCCLNVVTHALHLAGFDPDYDVALDEDYTSDHDMDGMDPDFDYVLNPEDDELTYLQRDENGAPVLQTGMGTDDEGFVSIGGSSEEEFDEQVLALMED